MITQFKFSKNWLERELFQLIILSGLPRMASVRFVLTVLLFLVVVIDQSFAEISQNLNSR